MTGLERVLRDHLWSDRPGQTCGCGWEADHRWMIDKDAPNRVEQWLVHVAAAVTAWLAARLASEQVRGAVAEVLYTEERDGLPPENHRMPEWDDATDEQRAWWLHNADAALTAVLAALEVER